MKGERTLRPEHTLPAGSHNLGHELSEIADRGLVPLVICRHGRTRYNLERRFLGRLDIPLDRLGRREAATLGTRLGGLDRAALYSSPLARAWQTAECIGPPVAVDHLQELDQGLLEGHTGDQMVRKYPEFFRQWALDPELARVPGGETMGECRDRAVTAVCALAARHGPGRPLVLVTHQMVMAGLVLTAIDLPLRFFRKVSHHNVAISVLGWSEAGGLELFRLNDWDHADGLDD